MLQPLPAERFKLTFHHQSTARTTLVLLVDRSGAKLRAAFDGEQPGSSQRFEGGVMMAQFTRSGMNVLASFLSRQLREPVLDRTGITGLFDFSLRAAPEVSAVDSPGPSIRTALQEQLGLRLDSQKINVDVMVIDHADRPTLN